MNGTSAEKQAVCRNVLQSAEWGSKQNLHFLFAGIT